MAAARETVLQAAEDLGYPPSVVPTKKTLGQYKNAEIQPSLVMILLVELATDRAVTFHDWVPRPELLWEIDAAVMGGDPAAVQAAVASARGARRT